jgi:hypothetical protein
MFGDRLGRTHDAEPAVPQTLSQSMDLALEGVNAFARTGVVARCGR